MSFDQPFRNTQSARQREEAGKAKGREYGRDPGGSETVSQGRRRRKAESSKSMSKEEEQKTREEGSIFRYALKFLTIKNIMQSR